MKGVMGVLLEYKEAVERITSATQEGWDRL
jgi:hypothetical protein